MESFTEGELSSEGNFLKTLIKTIPFHDWVKPLTLSVALKATKPTLKALECKIRATPASWLSGSDRVILVSCKRKPRESEAFAFAVFVDFESFT